jgi:hypothetical protein
MAKKISSTDIFDKEDIFEGIRLSAQKTVEQLMEVDAEFKKLAQTTKDILGKSTTTTTQGIHDFTKATQDANKAVEQSVKIEKLKAQAEQQALKAEQEREKVAQQKQRTAQAQAKEQERLNKLQERTAKLAANEGNAYKQLEKQARDLKNESKRLGAELLNLEKAGKRNTAEYQKLSAQYFETTGDAQKMDAQLKSLDKTVGDNFRNVGNYEGAVTNLKTELRNLTMQMANMDEADPRFQEMATRAGELRDKMADTKAVIQATAGSAVENFGKAFARAGELATRGVQGVVSGMQLLGIEDADTLKNIQQLQALGGLADSLGALGGLGDALTEIRTGLTAAAVKSGILVQIKTEDVTATVAQTVAQNSNTAAITANTLASEANIAVSETGNIADAESVLLTEANALATTEETVATLANTGATIAQATATEGATAAQYGLNTAMLTNPVVLVTAGIVALGAALYYVFGREKKLTDEQIRQRENNKKRLAQEKEMVSAVSQESSAFLLQIERLKQTNAGSKERSSLIKEINSQYGTTLKNMSSELAFQNQLNQASLDWIKLQEARYKVKAAEKEFVDLLNDEKDLRKEIRDLEKPLPGGVGTNLYKIENGIVKSTRAIGEQAHSQELDFLKQTQKEYDNLIARLEANKKRKQELAKIATEATGAENKYVNKAVTGNGSVGTSLTEVTTKFGDLNKEMGRTLDLMQTIVEQQQAKELRESQRAIDYALTEEINRIKAGGDAQVDALEQIVFERFNLERQYAEDKMKFDIDQLEANYQYQKKVRQDALDKEKKDLEDAAKKEIKDKTALQSKLAEIETNYQTQQTNLTQYELEQYADVELEKTIARNNYMTQRVEITKSEGAEINRVNDAVYDALDERVEKSAESSQKTREEELAEIAKIEEQKREIIKVTSEFFQKQSDKRIAQYDKEIAAAEKQYDVLKGLAESGNINAEQSLAEQQRIIDEANRKKEQELQRQQRIKLAESVYSTYSQKVSDGSKNPLAETIRDTTLLQQFINSLPTFFDGTEDTGSNGRGIDGRGGFQAVLHPNERVIPKHLNEKIGSLSNTDLARVAQEYNNGKIVEGGQQTRSALEFALLVNELKDLKSVIKDKPETNIELGQITNSVMEIVQSQKRGNSVTYNRFKVRK